MSKALLNEDIFRMKPLKKKKKKKEKPDKKHKQNKTKLRGTYKEM